MTGISILYKVQMRVPNWYICKVILDEDVRICVGIEEKMLGGDHWVILMEPINTFGYKTLV